MSLLRIALRDFVIVRELALDLSNGFSVLSGETGAGKSILVDALQLVVALEKHFGLKMSDGEAAKGILHSVSTIAAEITSRPSASGVS